jgi:hypothetical protein
MWDWNYLTRVSSIDDIYKHPDRPWNKVQLRRRTDLTLDLALKYVPDYASACVCEDSIRNNLDYNWDIDTLSRRSSISVDTIMLISKNIDWRVRSYHSNKEDLIKYPHLPWDIEHLSMNTEIPISILIRQCHTFNEKVWTYISCGATLEDISSNPDLPWNRNYLSINKNICMKIIRMNLPNSMYVWNWDLISRHISLEDIVNNPNERWNRREISTNISKRSVMCLDVIKIRLPNSVGDWNWETLSMSVSMPTLLKYYYYPWILRLIPISTLSDMNRLTCLTQSRGIWDYSYISKYIIQEDVINNPNLPWDKECLSSNKNITLGILSMNLPNSTGKWCFYYICRRHPIMDCIKHFNKNREAIKTHKELSIWWVDFVDKVGICRDPKYESDIEIICIH